MVRRAALGWSGSKGSAKGHIVGLALSHSDGIGTAWLTWEITNKMGNTTRTKNRKTYDHPTRSERWQGRAFKMKYAAQGKGPKKQ